MTPGCTGKPRRSEGMTDSRIKELADDTVHAMMRSYCFATGRVGEGRDEITKALRAVAAEAREEGREEGIEAACSLLTWKAAGIVRRKLLAERLKEKG
ncbi:MAG: hypothetical protein ABIG39_06710 [Candidatus Micrarchaeota archaeon]